MNKHEYNPEFLLKLLEQLIEAAEPFACLGNYYSACEGCRLRDAIEEAAECLQ